MSDPQGHGAVVIGCSAGGIAALQHLFASLSPQLALPILVVCHFGDRDIAGLCSLLGRGATMPVVEAREREVAAPGKIHIAPGGYHLHVERNGAFALSVDEKVCYCRPSIDVMFESAAWCHGRALVGVILTGANDDGAAGLQAVRRNGGRAIVQTPEDAVAPEMPRAALALAGADFVVPLPEIGPTVNGICLHS